MLPGSVDSEALAGFLRERVGDHLRSVVHYTAGDHEVVYARDDVLAQYSREEVAAVVDELGIESAERPIKEGLYVHGDLDCTIRCFQRGIEMHFIVEDGEGVAVSLDPEAFVAQGTFVGRCLEELDLDDYG